MKPITRRQFIAGSAITAGAILSSPRAVGANERIQVGVVGLRNRGPQVAEAMLDSGEFEITTICDCDTAMLGEAKKNMGAKFPEAAKFEQDFRTLLEDKDIDLIVNATPDHWHAGVTLLALDAAKNVYLEKPASYNINEGKAMVAAQEAHPDLLVAMGTQQRSGPHFKDAHDFIQGGGLGKISFARAWITHQRGLLPIVPDSDPPKTLDYEMWVGPAPYQAYNEQKCHYNWHFQKAYGTGEMGNWGAHWLDIARWFLHVGIPNGAMGHGGIFATRDAKEWPDTQTVIYDYPELTLLWEERIWTKHTLNSSSSGAEFNGEKGSLIITRGGWVFIPKDGKELRHGSSELMQPHVKNFAAALRGQEKAIAPISEGHKSAVLCHMGNIAVQLNRRVNFNADTQDFGDDAEANSFLGRVARASWNTIPGWL